MIHNVDQEQHQWIADRPWSIVVVVVGVVVVVVVVVVPSMPILDTVGFSRYVRYTYQY
jgi:hypothetical protein